MENRKSASSCGTCQGGEEPFVVDPGFWEPCQVVCTLEEGGRLLYFSASFFQFKADKPDTVWYLLWSGDYLFNREAFYST